MEANSTTKTDDEGSLETKEDLLSQYAMEIGIILVAGCFRLTAMRKQKAVGTEGGDHEDVEMVDVDGEGMNGVENTEGMVYDVGFDQMQTVDDPLDEAQETH